MTLQPGSMHETWLSPNTRPQTVLCFLEAPWHLRQQPCVVSFIINIYHDEFPHEVNYFGSTVIVIGNFKVKAWPAKRDPYTRFRPPLGDRINILIVPFVYSFHDLQSDVSKNVLYLPPMTPVTGKEARGNTKLCQKVSQINPYNMCHSAFNNFIWCHSKCLRLWEIGAM